MGHDARLATIPRLPSRLAGFFRAEYTFLLMFGLSLPALEREERERKRRMR